MRSAYLVEPGKLVKVADVTEELEADAGGDDQETHGEQDQVTQLLSRSEDLKINRWIYNLCIKTYQRQISRLYNKRKKIKHY